MFRTHSWYETGNGLETFALLDSGLSNLWMKLLQVRDKTFGTKLAKNMLDSEQILTAEFVNLIGRNMGRESITLRTPRFSHYIMIDKYGLVKGFKSKLRSTVLNSSSFKAFEGDKIISTSRCWEVQRGQVKIPVKKKISQNISQLLKIFSLLVNFAEQVDDEDSWDFLDYVQELDSDDPRIEGNTNDIKEDLNKCVEAEMKGQKHSPKTFDIDSKLRCQMPDALEESRSVKLVYGKAKSISWADGAYERDGLDVAVKDVVQAVAKAGKTIRRIKVEFYSKNFKHSYPLHDLIETQIQNEDGPVFKLGNLYYEVKPKHDHHLEVNMKFLEVLKAHLVGEEYSEHFPLPWRQCQDPKEKRSATKIKSKQFTIDELVESCIIDEGKDVDSKSKKVLAQILTKEVVFVDAENINQMYRREEMNCSLMRKSTLEVEKHCFKIEELSLLLASEDEITEEKLQALKQSIGAKEMMKTLQLKRQVCIASKQVDEDRLAVIEPHLTKTQIEEMEGVLGSQAELCVPRLIQFLRMQLPMDEGQYNELYLLSNCHHPRHSSGWVFLTLDRVLIAGNIEICDVLAYNHKKALAVLLHVKDGANADKARAVCSQVRVSCEEIVRSLTIDRDPDVFQMIYNRATNPTQKSLYRQSLKSTIQSIFADKEDFVNKMTEAKFDICMAVADKNANRWKDMNGIDLKRDLSDVVGDPKMLEAFVKLGYLTPNNKRIKQKMIETTKADITNEVSKMMTGVKKSEISEAVTNVFTAITAGDKTAEFLRGDFITKMIINDLHDTFQGLLEQKVKLRIMPIPV